MKPASTSVVLALAASFLLAACASSPETHFYALSGVPPASAPAKAGAVTRYQIAIGPLTLPNSVDRAQLVTQPSAHRVELYENHRWAESLKTEIPRIVAQNLAIRLPDTQVAAYPQYAATHAPDVTVHIDIQRFEAVPGQKTVVEALCTLQRNTSPERFSTFHSVLEETIDGSGFDAVAAAYSRSLGRLSDRIAEAITASAKP